MQCTDVWYSTVQYRKCAAVHGRAAQGSAVQCSVETCGAGKCGAGKCGAGKCGAVQYSVGTCCAA